MIERTNPQPAADTTHTIALLDGQANHLRAELVRLRRELAQVQSEINGNRIVQLKEANSQLMQAALNAEAIAEIAVANLADLTYVSQRDALTHTANRALMFDRLTSALESAKENNTRIAVIFLDLDHFRYINNTLGHAGGDVVLQLVASRLESALSEGDTVSRHGGDEFLVLLTNVPEVGDAARIAESLLAAIAIPSSVGEVRLQLSASLGIAIYPDDGVDMATLIDRADVAMYRSKGLGHGGFQFHSDTLSGVAERRSTLLQSLPLIVRDVIPPHHENHLAELREANEQLMIAALSAQELEAHAREANRQQIKFMAVVAHELRNPLTPIKVAASLLMDQDIRDAESLARLQMIIDAQVTHMSRLISDLMDGSRITTGKLRLERRVVDIIGILRDAVEAAQPAMLGRTQRLEFELPAGPLAFFGDPVRLMQVFSNLLDNASKYTPESGEIALSLTVRKRWITVSVSDNGIGISAEALPTIFDLFVQDARALDHAGGGLGIGLAVVRELVEAHDGTVTGASAGTNLGSQFTVRLPMDRPMDGPA